MGLLRSHQRLAVPIDKDLSRRIEPIPLDKNMRAKNSHVMRQGVKLKLGCQILLAEMAIYQRSFLPYNIDPAKMASVYPGKSKVINYN